VVKKERSGGGHAHRGLCVEFRLFCCTVQRADVLCIIFITVIWMCCVFFCTGLQSSDKEVLCVEEFTESPYSTCAIGPSTSWWRGCWVGPAMASSSSSSSSRVGHPQQQQQLQRASSAPVAGTEASTSNNAKSNVKLSVANKALTTSAKRSSSQISFRF